MRIKIDYQINEKDIMKKIEMCYLQKSKLSQQKRNYERRIYKHQVKELKKKLEDLTQAIGLLKTPNS